MNISTTPKWTVVKVDENTRVKIVNGCSVLEMSSEDVLKACEFYIQCYHQGKVL